MHLSRLFLPLLFASLAATVFTRAAETPLSALAIPKDPAALATPEKLALADNVLAYQYSCGAWPKNIDMRQPFTDATRARLADPKNDFDPTIDNGATTTQIRFLAAVFTATGHARHRDSALRGIDYLLDAQYANGGWPQYFPLRKGYYAHITFNDDAMINVMELLRDVASAKAPYVFVDQPRRTRAADALTRGLECILRTQIVVDGRPTAWAAQHDEVTLAPAAARKFEPTCYASAESAGIVRYLLAMDRPTPAIIAAVEGAVAWFNQTKITGIRVDLIATPEGKDRVVIPDPAAPPIWARFYELGTLRPIFSGRDSVIHYSLAEIERERRGGYAWYVDRPAEILKKHPTWAARRQSQLPPP